ncbi:hypothetical protein FSP39_004817 [Pinctada imbricata]|uniref:C-type lectin domain-containing protein n=1 Tax=Pinctada imbricata TaxID=66713 RepID=A0AA88XVM2_PINIB|nr:hypothetical protein FSP39_004817 [Pinctada imbricata]
MIHEGHWIWAQTLDRWEFQLWHRGEPNGKTRENCLEFGSHWNYTWNDAHCDDKKHFICEKP